MGGCPIPFAAVTSPSAANVEDPQLLFDSWVSDKLVHVIFVKKLGAAGIFKLTGLSLYVNGNPVPITSFFHPVPGNPNAFCFVDGAVPAPGQTIRLKYAGGNPSMKYADSSPILPFDVSGTS